MRLGAWLLSKGKIGEDQLQKALQHQSFFGGRLGSSLIKLGYIDEDVLGAYLSDVSGSAYAPPPLLENVPAEVIALVPGRLAAQYRVVPIGVEGRRLRLAMRDPRDLIALDEIAFLTGLTIEPYVATEFRIQRALQRYYELPSSTRSAVPIAAASTSAPAPARPAPSAGRLASPAPQGAELGFDGYPLDADPDLVLTDSGRLARVPPATGEVDLPPPTSLEEWRLAQAEIPEEIPLPDPERETPSPAAITSPHPAVRAAAPQPHAATSPAADVAFAEPKAEASPDPGFRPQSGPHTLESIAARLRVAESRDDVFHALLDFTSSRFRRCALFVVQADRVLGWSGRGPGLDTSRVRQVIVPLDRPSLFSFFRRGADYYHGPVSDLPANTRFFLDLGCPPPARVFLLPLSIKERPTVVLYADNETESGWTVDVEAHRRAHAKAALALEILILKNKITTL